MIVAKKWYFSILFLNLVVISSIIKPAAEAEQKERIYTDQEIVELFYRINALPPEAIDHVDQFLQPKDLFGPNVREICPKTIWNNPNDRAQLIVFSNNDRFLACKHQDMIRIYDTTTDAVREIPHATPIARLAISSDGASILTLSSGQDDLTACVVDGRTGKTIGVLPTATALSFDSHDNILTATSIPGGNDDFVYSWDRRSLRLLHTQKRSYKGFVSLITNTPDGQSIITGADTGTQIGPVQGDAIHFTEETPSALTCNNNVIAMGTLDYSNLNKNRGDSVFCTEIYKIAPNHECRIAIQYGRSRIDSLSLNHHNQLAIADADHVTVWNLGKKLATLIREFRPMANSFPAVSPRGTRILTNHLTKEKCTGALLRLWQPTIGVSLKYLAQTLVVNHTMKKQLKVAKW